MIEAIKTEDAELGELIKDALFVFDNLLKVDDRGMQAILREVQADTLGDGAQRRRRGDSREDLQEHVEARRGDLARRHRVEGPGAALREVEQAQKEILAVALRLPRKARSCSRAAAKSSSDALARHRQGRGARGRPLGLPGGRPDGGRRVARRGQRRRAPAHGRAARRARAAGARRKRGSAASRKGSRPARPKPLLASHALDALAAAFTQPFQALEQAVERRDRRARG